MTHPDFAPFSARMRAEALPDVAIRTFEHYYNELAKGKTGLLPEAALRPVESLPDAEALSSEMTDLGRQTLSQTVLIKLNGGLGTGMGLEKAKSLLRIRGELTFLDVIARQALWSGVLLVLMNSYNTRDDSLAILKNYPALRSRIPLDFGQHKVPKVVQADLSPALWPAAPELEWAPPGHGDLYTALLTSGMLETLLSAGFLYAFVSNADNLGAVIDPTILGYIVANRLPFLMEVADRTPSDRKGGHLARLAETGRLVLRESAQCPSEDSAAFQDISRYRYFNTNNLWLSLPSLKALLTANRGVLRLPMIRNSKTVDPRDPMSTPVYQLETAMGAAISLFDGAGALRVRRTRFAPVKTTDDLLAVRSDAYKLTEDFRVIPNPARTFGPVVVDLDPKYYRLSDEMETRFPYGPPSLVDCRRLCVRGDVRFGRQVVCRDVVEITNLSGEQIQIPDGATIGGDRAF